jgi:DNA repair exonuclease SbcCD ATPase subunit
MIVFKTARWKNVLSTGNVFTEVKLNAHHTTLVVGKNGHGKSTLLDVLTFALFGKPFRKINKGNLVNSINRKDCLVELEFSIGSREYLIRRGMNPGLFEIEIDGNPVNQDSVSRDYQKYLENNILKFNYRAFTQIAILGSKSFVPFMKLIPQDRRTIIENLLDIQIFSSMNKVAREDLKKAFSDIADNKKEITNIQQKIELQKRYVEESKKNVQAEIEKREADIVTHQQALDKLDGEDAVLSKAYEKLIVDDRDKVDKMLRQLKEFEVKIKSNKGKACKDHEFYTNNEHCPTCQQTIQSDFRLEAINKANTSISQFDTALDQLHGETEKWQMKLNGIRETLTLQGEIESQRSRLRVSHKHIVTYIKKVDGEIAELKGQRVLSDDMMKVSEDLVTELERRVEVHKGLVENRAYLELAVEFLKDGGIKAQIIKQYLPVINQLVNKYLAAMDFFVNFELNEEFEETIKSRHRDQFTYDSFSEGEKQKIDIALLFAWRAVAKMKNSLNCNLLILDEIFDSSLDGVGADLVLTILEAMAHEANVFVISHRELLHDKFENTLRFQKLGNFSEIVDTEE